MNKKIRVLAWVLVLLIVLNLSVVGTFIFQNRFRCSKSQMIHLDRGRERDSRKCFSERMKFNKEQAPKFQEAETRFKERASVHVSTLDSLKILMFSQLNIEKMDSVQMRQICRAIGEEHAALKWETVLFYRELRNLAKPEQYEMLRQGFMPLFREGCGERKREGCSSR